MDLRTKLVFALVAVSLGSLLALGTVAYTAVAELLQAASVRQLEALAASKQLDCGNLAAAWRDRVRLVTSRTQLRESLRRLAGGEANEAGRIAQIVEDALDAAPALRGIALFTPDGRLVVTRGEVPEEPAPTPAGLRGDPPWVETGVEVHAGGSFGVTFVSPLKLDGQEVGMARIVLDAAALAGVVNDATGLGETGETLVARSLPSGEAYIVMPRRRGRNGAPGPWRPAAPAGDPVQAAIGRQESTFLEAVDDRGQPVWAATRYVEEMDWGLIVKIDAVEASAAARALRETMIRMSVALSSLAIVAGILLGVALARPITALADVARRVEEGDLDARAQPSGEDEVAQLAGAFNEMTERLVDANRELERRVKAAENGNGARNS